MTSYANWLEETIGFTEDDFLLDENVEAKDSVPYGDLPYAFDRDAVLCLVDCRSEMFTFPTQTQYSTVSPNQTVEHRFKTEEYDLSTPLTSPCRNFDVRCQGTASTLAHLTAFGRALQGVNCLYRSKSISRDHDVLALVLYNTAVERNTHGCPGVYIYLPFNELDLNSVYEIEQLVTAAADPGSKAYMKFVREVGHLPAHQPLVLSEALRAAHCMFLGLGTKTARHKRIFVFTDDDDPTRGSVLEHDRCIARSHSLADMGVIIEVFGVGGSVVERAVPATTVTTVSVEDGHAAATPSGTPADANIMTMEPPVEEHAFLPKGNAVFVENVGNAAFTGCDFWKRLLYEVGERKPQSVSFSTGELTFHNSSCHTDCDTRTVGIGGSLGSSFEGFLELIRWRIHPQRPFMNCRLFIGARADGEDVPHMAISLYSPLLPATGQSTGWVEAATKAPVNRRVVLKVKKEDSISTRDDSDNRQLHSSGAQHHFEKGAGRGDGCTSQQDTVLRPEEVRYCAQIGGSTIIFSRAERDKIADVATAQATDGLTIVCFKRYEDVIQYKHIVHRSAFVHANLSEGGHNSLRLFVQLVRTLRAQGKVGIAQYVMKNVPPRLVALVPSPDFAAVRQHIPPETSIPTQGLGFYMVPLPYADDILPVPDLALLPSRTKEPAPKIGPDAVSETDIQLARRVIDALSVRYDILTVPNPSLQLQHRVLEELMLRQPVSPKPGQVVGEPLPRTSPSATAFSGFKDLEAGRAAMTTVRDWTLPDKAVMARHAERFQDFNAFVLGSSYDADGMCGQSRTTAGASRRPRACIDNASYKKDNIRGENPAPAPGTNTHREYGNCNQSEGTGVYSTVEEIKELVRDAADRNAWHRLTVVQLKEYLRTVGQSIGNARNKDALIESVKDAYLKREG